MEEDDGLPRRSPGAGRRQTPAELRRRSHPPERPAQRELEEYVAHLRLVLGGGMKKDVRALLRRWVKLFVGIWGDHRASIGRQEKDADDAQARRRPTAVKEGGRGALPYVAYTAAWPREGRGQPGWKLRFAWACTMDGFDPRCAAIFEDVAVRSTPALRREYKQWLLSDPGHEAYVLKRWRQTFRSLFDNLAHQDQAMMREHRLPGTEDWIDTRSGRGKRRRE